MRSLLFVLALLVVPHPAAAQVNLLTNPDFDTDVAGWDVFFFPNPGTLLTWDTMDVDGSLTSGSARVQVDWMDIGNNVSLTQCVIVDPQASYSFSGWVFNPSSTPAGSTFLRLFWYSDEVCGPDAELGNADSPGAFIEEDSWVLVSREDVIPPPATASAQLFVITFEDNLNLAQEVAFWDSISLVPEPDTRLAIGIGCLAILLCGPNRFRCNAAARG